MLQTAKAEQRLAPSEEGFVTPRSPVPTDWPTLGLPPVLCSKEVQVNAWSEELPEPPAPANIPVRVGDPLRVHFQNVARLVGNCCPRRNEQAELRFGAALQWAAKLR